MRNALSSRRRLAVVRRELLRRRQPHGLVSINYIRRPRSATSRLHRRALAQAHPQLPRPLAHVLTALQWTQWMAFEGWRSAAEQVDRWGGDVAEHTHVSKAEQLRLVRSAALAHGVHPLDFYRHGFWDAELRKDMLAYVFDCELPGAHAMEYGDAARARVGLLSDKERFAQLLVDHQIKGVATQVVLDAGSQWTDVPESGQESWFCKPVRGSGGRGVFRVSKAGPVLRAWRVSGAEIASGEVEAFVNDRLRTSAYLVQPVVQNHADISALVPTSNEPITVRVVTRRRASQVKILCSFVELPRVGSRGTSYVPVAIERDTGLLGRTIRPRQLDWSGSVHHAAPVDNDVVIPFWDEVQGLVHQAHALFQGIPAIAWDIIVTDNGPVLLEGNTGWSVYVPQQICGPFGTAEHRT